MATFKLYPNGMTMGRGNAQPVGGKRGIVDGWSKSSVRRHKKWLYSVIGPDLDGVGEAVTLTMRDTPATSDDWVYLLSLLWQRLRDTNGFIRAHWVVEWQKRGTPHLHLAVYGDEALGETVVGHWLALAAPYTASRGAQFVTPITGPIGWLQYLSKHASRGVHHYQRQGKPEGWTKTGRLWGRFGEWPTAEPLEGALSQREYVILRRLVRSYASAEARTRALNLGRNRRALERLLGSQPLDRDERNAWRAVKRLRRMHADPNPGLSASRGCSEWVPEAVMIRLLEFVAATRPASAPSVWATT